MDIWHGVCPKGIKLNTVIKRRVEAYHYNKDLKKVEGMKCLYTTLTSFDKKKMKYILDERFSKVGTFESSEHRSCFIYALLDTCSYKRECSQCGASVLDIVQHYVEDCRNMQKLRRRLSMTMQLYNAPMGVNFSNKEQLFRLAMRKPCYLKVLCQFLKEV